MMDRRRFLTAAGAVATGCFGTARAQPGLLRFADMHSHIGMRSPTRIREVMSANGMLLLARKIVADAPVIRALPGQGYRMVREPNPGELAQRFDDWFARLHRQHQAEGLPEIASASALERVRRDGTPSVVLAAEGAISWRAICAAWSRRGQRASPIFNSFTIAYPNWATYPPSVPFMAA